MGRTIVVGDVHGCADELDALLDRVAACHDDRVIFVGDLVVKGPKPRDVLAIVRDIRGEVVRGNHEQRLLNTRGRHPRKDRRSYGLVFTAHELRDSDWNLIASTPLWIDLPEHDARVVHAGVVPGRPMAAQRAHDLLNMRCLDAAGDATADRRGGPLWASRYAETPHVVFGHNAVDGLQLHPHATGLDTGCVYGGQLTALVLAEGQRLPPPESRREALRQVDARRVYCPV